MNFFSLFVLLLISLDLFAQSGSYLKIDSSKPIKIDYQANSWNKNPEAVDYGALIFRDAGSGRLARIEMQESGVNTGKFIGHFVIGFQPDADVLPEIFIAPLAMVKSSDQLKKVETLIKDGTLIRRPFFLRQEGRNFQTMSVFDTREQALQAYNEYKANKPLVDRAALETQQRAEIKAEKLGLQRLEQTHESERQAMEIEEKNKIDELKKQQALLDSAEKSRRLLLAEKMAKEAMALYKKENYAKAEEKFAKSTELDPDNTNYYYQYGVTLYKNDKFNQSIVALNLAQGSELNSVERDYYIALNHMKLKEYDKAQKEFMAIKEKNDKALSASSAFFAGVIDFQKENFDRAKTSFEYTLDNSSDPKMDQQAEAYIEQIANIKSFLAQKAKKFIFNGNLGLSYDSNILNQATNTASNLGGFRWAYGGSIEYRPVYSPVHEFSAILSLSDLYSTDSSFKAKSEFQQTDPLTLIFGLPYKYKGQLFTKPYQLSLTPSYETTNMNQDGVGSRENIVNSVVAKADNTFVMSEDWFSTYSLELRSDSSKISVGTDDDQTATKVTLSTAQTTFKDKKKTEAVIYDGGVSLNQAKGINQQYQRVDLGASYAKPWAWATIWNARLGVYYANYPNHTSGRKDTDYTLSTGLQKILSERWATNLALSYTNNSSNVSSSAYNKYIISTGIAYNNSF